MQIFANSYETNHPYKEYFGYVTNMCFLDVVINPKRVIENKRTQSSLLAFTHKGFL